MENGQIGCINHDENAVNNMIKIVNHYLDKKERPLKYRRDYDLEKGEIKKRIKTKEDNLQQKVHYKSGGQVSTKPMIGSITLN
jgi:hypothetical protein